MTGTRILVVDDEPGVRSALEAILNDEGFEVTCAGSGEEGLEAFAGESFDAVLLDVWLPGIDGLETLSLLRERHPDTEVVMISGHGTIDTAVRATKLGAFDFIEKPLSLEKTLLVLRNALRQRRLEQVNRQLMSQLTRDTEILGESDESEQLREQVASVAATEAPVLIRGRAGVGREPVARRIHAAGRFAGRPFVHVPCGALDAEAVEAAIFGSDEQPGRLALARGGSLFLEDVDRLPVEVQRRLAASLEAQDPVSVRLLASAAPDGPELDPELRNCLDVVRIEMASLTERRGDIPLLAQRFMRELSREYGREPKRLGPEALAALQAYDWPGEVQELRNLMERLLLATAGDSVRVEDLPAGAAADSRSQVDLLGELPSLDEGLRLFERYHVRRVLAEERQDVQRAARRLGIDAARVSELRQG